MKTKQLLSLGALLALLLVFLPAGQTAHAATWEVTNTDDSGEGSLRWAINQANASTGPDSITFSISGAGVHTIQPHTSLPFLVDDGTSIDGYKQPGAQRATASAPAVILIEIDGSLAGDYASGLVIVSSDNVVEGLAINRFDWNGIALGAPGSFIATLNVIAGNYVGTDAAGTAALGNGQSGVFIGMGANQNTVGGTTPAERNVLSGNGWEGVGIHGSGTMSNTVAGNYIGTDATGSGALGNALFGVRVYGGAQENLIGGDAATAGNLISGNEEDGVHIVGEGTISNTVIGNLIGTAAGGMAPMANAIGIQIADGARDNLIGGSTPAQRNVISGNQEHGIKVGDAGTSGNVVQHNLIGIDATGTAALANAACGVYLENGASENVVGPGNIVSANLAGVCMSDTTTMSNTVIGNVIGTDVTGAAPLGNTLAGVYLMGGAQCNIVGGSYTERNIISGNEGSGVIISGTGTVSNTILGNFIGLTADDLTLLGNDGNGVLVAAGAQDNIIGPGNIIAGSALDGVVVEGEDTYGNRVTQNTIVSNTMGIHLLDGGNGGIAAPVITVATIGPESITVEGSACSGCMVEVFANTNDDGEGMYYLGSTVAAGGDFVLTVSSHGAPVHMTTTATATDDADGTSEFSAAYTVTVSYVLYLPVVLKAAP